MICLVMLGKLHPLLVCGSLTHLANDSFKCLSVTGEARGTKARYHIFLLVLKCSALQGHPLVMVQGWAVCAGKAPENPAALTYWT